MVLEKRRGNAPPVLRDYVGAPVSGVPRRCQMGNALPAGPLPSVARIGIESAPRGCSSMVEQQPSKLNTRVRFPSPAPASARFFSARSPSARRLGAASSRSSRTVAGGAPISRRPLAIIHAMVSRPSRLPIARGRWAGEDAAMSRAMRSDCWAASIGRPKQGREVKNACPFASLSRAAAGAMRPTAAEIGGNATPTEIQR